MKNKLQKLWLLVATLGFAAAAHAAGETTDPVADVTALIDKSKLAFFAVATVGITILGYVIVKRFVGRLGSKSA